MPFVTNSESGPITGHMFLSVRGRVFSTNNIKITKINNFSNAPRLFLIQQRFTCSFHLLILLSRYYPKKCLNLCFCIKDYLHFLGCREDRRVILRAKQCSYVYPEKCFHNNKETEIACSAQRKQSKVQEHTQDNFESLGCYKYDFVAHNVRSHRTFKAQ